MSLLEPQPPYHEIQNTLFKNPLKLSSYWNSAEFKAITQKANEDYIYWDKFKYLHFPEPFQAEEAWALLKLNRRSQLKPLEFKDKGGAPFHYWVPAYIHQTLHFIDLQAGGNILLDTPLEENDRQRYIVNSVMEEAISSSIMEGAAATRKEAKELLQKNSPPKNKSERMIVNNYVTIQKLQALSRSPLTPETIQDIHRMITQSTLEEPADSGRFRTGEEVVYVRNNEKILFTSPQGADVEARIRFICDFANDTHDREFIHPVIKAILIHFFFAYTHPFADGNGRTARALFYWYLSKKNYWLFQYLSISKIILNKPGQYEKAFLYSEHDDNDLTYFIRFNVSVIDEAIREIMSYIKQKNTEAKERHHLLSAHHDLNERQVLLLHHVLNNPHQEITFKMHQTVHSIVYQTARTDILGLVKKGYLSGHLRGKKQVFSATPNLADFLKK